MNRNFIFASLVLAIAVNIAIIGCHRKGENETNNPAGAAKAVDSSENDTPLVKNIPVNSSIANASIEIRTFANDSILKGFGYDIYLDGKLYVHQPHIPAIAGNMGFSTSEKARRTGEYVSYKIKHKIIPPSLSPHELDSLGVLK